MAICIPVTWSTSDGTYHLAYHHGWTDARFYSVVRILAGEDLPDYIATVDDFGDLVPVADVPAFGFAPLPRWSLWIQSGDLH
jgi:hypothetical protein